MGVSSSESHDLTAFYEMLTASFGVLSPNTGFYPSLDRIVETMLGPLNLGPGGRSYNEPISRLHRLSEISPPHLHLLPGALVDCTRIGQGYPLVPFWPSSALPRASATYPHICSHPNPHIHFRAPGALFQQ